MGFKILAIFLFLFYSNIVFADKFCVDCHQERHHLENSCTSCHAGIKGTKRKDIAHYKIIEGKFLKQEDTKKGIEIIEKAKCKRCHFIGDGGNFFSSNLNNVLKRLSAREIYESIKKPTSVMPNFDFSNNSLEHLVNAIISINKENNETNITQTLPINNGYFNLVEKKCGACHKFISSSDVVNLENGSFVINLSAIFTKNYYSDVGWDEKKLKDWLTNPRLIKANATMPIIELSNEEIADIVNILK